MTSLSVCCASTHINMCVCVVKSASSGGANGGMMSARLPETLSFNTQINSFLFGMIFTARLI